MTTIRDLFVDYNDDQMVDKIECSSIRALDSSTKEFHIYNPKVHQPLRKFIYLLDNVKLDKKLKGGKQIKMVLSSRDEKLIGSISNLDERINEYITYLNEAGLDIGSKVSELIVTSDYYPPVLQVTSDRASVIDTDGTAIKIMNIPNGSMIKAIVELERVEVKYGSIEKIWRVIQIKKSQSISTDASIDLFDAYEGRQNSQEIQSIRTTYDLQRGPIQKSDAFRPIERDQTAHFAQPSQPAQLAQPTQSTQSAQPAQSNQSRSRGFSPPSALDLRAMIGQLRPARTEDTQTMDVATNNSDTSTVPAAPPPPPVTSTNDKNDKNADSTNDESSESIVSEGESGDDSIDPFKMSAAERSDTDDNDDSNDSDENSDDFDPFASVGTNKQTKTKPKTSKIKKAKSAKLKTRAHK